MIKGIKVTASPRSSSDGSRTETRGRPSIDTDIAPMPMPTQAIIERPGSWESRMPSAAPMNMPGNTGPPRKLLSERLYATLLQVRSMIKAPVDHDDALSTRVGMASWPENSTNEDAFP